MSVQQEKFKAIADAIRDKLGTTELIKPNDFAAKISEISGAGNTSPTYYLNAIAVNQFKEVTFPENTELTVKVKGAGSTNSINTAFLGTSNLKSIKLISEDTTAVINAMSAFRESSQLSAVDLTEFNRKFNTISYFFYGSPVTLVSGALDVSACTEFPQTTFGTQLVEIRFVGNTIKRSITFPSQYLSNASVQSIRYGLATLQEGDEPQILTFNTAVKNNLTQEQIAFITQSKGWTLA